MTFALEIRSKGLQTSVSRTQNSATLAPGGFHTGASALHGTLMPALGVSIVTRASSRTRLADPCIVIVPFGSHGRLNSVPPVRSSHGFSTGPSLRLALPTMPHFTLRASSAFPVSSKGQFAASESSSPAMGKPSSTPPPKIPFPVKPPSKLSSSGTLPSNSKNNPEMVTSSDMLHSADSAARLRSPRL